MWVSPIQHAKDKENRDLGSQLSDQNSQTATLYTKNVSNKQGHEIATT